MGVGGGRLIKKERDVVVLLKFVLTNLNGLRKKLLLFTINAAKKYNLLSEEQIVLINNETFLKMKGKKYTKKIKATSKKLWSN